MSQIHYVIVGSKHILEKIYFFTRLLLLILCICFLLVEVTPPPHTHINTHTQTHTHKHTHTHTDPFIVIVAICFVPFSSEIFLNPTHINKSGEGRDDPSQILPPTPDYVQFTHFIPVKMYNQFKTITCTPTVYEIFMPPNTNFITLYPT